MSHIRSHLAAGTLGAFVEGGKGDPLLLVHGYPEIWQTWRTWRHAMPPLTEHNTVIAVGMRGRSESEISAAGYDTPGNRERHLHGVARRSAARRCVAMRWFLE